MELRRVFVIAARHASDAEEKLREEREVETEKQEDGGELRPPLWIQPPGDFRPPEMNASQVRRYRAADHDVVKMRDDEVCVGQMNI